MVANDALTLMDSGRIQRSLKRIAYQIAESNKQDKPVILLGINRKGYLVAKELNNYLAAIYTSYEVKSVRLSLEDTGTEWSLIGKDELDTRFLVLVDDVIFSGRTMFRALELLSRKCSLNEVHTVVLVDRGHRNLPIDAQFVGLDLPTKLNEHVSLIMDDDRILEVKLSSV